MIVKELKHVEVGQTFELGGLEWLVLEHQHDKTLVTTKECIMDKAFDESNSNDFRNSSIRQYLNKDFLQELVDEDVDLDKILFTNFDLSDCQGNNYYGHCKDRVGLLTIEQFRKFKDILTLGDWWWLITPLSGYSRNVRSVGTGGTLVSNVAYHGGGGVRPALTLDADIKVYVDEVARLDNYSSEELLQELLKRMTDSY